MKLIVKKNLCIKLVKYRDKRHIKFQHIATTALQSNAWHFHHLTVTPHQLSTKLNYLVLCCITLV